MDGLRSCEFFVDFYRKGFSLVYQKAEMDSLTAG